MSPTSLTLCLTARARDLLVRVALQVLKLIFPSLRALFVRLDTSPGIPLSNPTSSYWTTPPAFIANHGSSPKDPVPQYADVVIIGSGITGTACARNLLHHDATNGLKDAPLQVVMLEARDACSGATGRNGGHVSPVLYQEYIDLKRKYGADTARKIIRFRKSHLPELLAVATEENLLDDCHCREVEALDVYYDDAFFTTAKNMLKEYQDDLNNHADYTIYERDDLKDLRLASAAIGCLATTGGAVHPYRLVTGILSRLVRSFSNFHLFTHTPCLEISSNAVSGSIYMYAVYTPKGTIMTPHVVHATNAWASHLLPGLRKKIIPVRGVMTAQQPRTEWSLLPATVVDNPMRFREFTGERSFVFYPGNEFEIFDYLTQQPATWNPSSSPYPPPRGELMLGGGFFSSKTITLNEIGNVDDGQKNDEMTAYLASAMDRYFEKNASSTEKIEDAAHIKKDKPDARLLASWSGILGLSVDERPWVGRVPKVISGRHSASMVNDAHAKDNLSLSELSTTTSDISSYLSPAAARLAPSGEWVCAGYSGEGMVHAWMSSKALVQMILNHDGSERRGLVDQDSMEFRGPSYNGWLPHTFKVTEERWKKASLENLITAHFFK